MLLGINLSGYRDQLARVQSLDYHIAPDRFVAARLPVDWDIIQPVLGGPLDPAVVKGYRDRIDRIRAKVPGAEIVLDLRNHGCYGDRPLISDVKLWYFGRVWQLLARAFPDCSYGLMNEMHDILGVSVLLITQTGINAIRGEGRRNRILVGLNGWGNRWAWRKGGENYELWPQLFDPAGNLAVDYHCYFDPWSAGQTTEIEPDWLTHVEYFTRWARGGKVSVDVGEWAVAADVKSMAAGVQFLAHLKANADVFHAAYWWGAGGYWQDDYPFTLDPYPTGWSAAGKSWAEPVDKPQMAILRG